MKLEGLGERVLYCAPLRCNPTETHPRHVYVSNSVRAQTEQMKRRCCGLQADKDAPLRSSQAFRTKFQRNQSKNSRERRITLYPCSYSLNKRHTPLQTVAIWIAVSLKRFMHQLPLPCANELCAIQWCIHVSGDISVFDQTLLFSLS